jgi:hypothetical protein
MFVKFINGELVYGDYIYSTGYTLTPADITQQVDGWKWFDTVEEAMAAISYFTPSDPTPLTLSEYRMFGLGSVLNFTPINSDKARFTIIYLPAGVGTEGTNKFKLCYGQGTPPVNGASAVGTVIGNEDIGGSIESNIFTRIPVIRNIIVTGLTPGYSYWFDVQGLKYIGNNSVGMTSIEATIQEII